MKFLTKDIHDGKLTVFLRELGVEDYVTLSVTLATLHRIGAKNVMFTIDEYVIRMNDKEIEVIK